MNNMFCSSVESQVCKDEIKKTQSLCTDDVQLKQNSLGSLPSSNDQLHESEDMVNVSSSWFYELSQENEILKQRNKDLMQTKIKRDSDFDAKENQISELLDKLVNTEMELEKVNEKCEEYEQENSHLKLQVEELTAQVHQYKHLEPKTNKDEGSTGLKNKFDQTIKDMDKLNLILRACRSQIATKTTLLRKMEIHIKHLWNFLVEFGNKLASSDLLVPHQKAALLKTREDYFALNINQYESETDLYEALNTLSTTSVPSIANTILLKTSNENEDAERFTIENSPPIFTSLSNETSSDDRSPVKLLNSSYADQINKHCAKNEDLLQQKDYSCSDIASEQQETSFANIQMSFSIAPFIGQEFLNGDSPKELSNCDEDSNTLISERYSERKSQDSDPKLQDTAGGNFSSEIIQPTLEVLPNDPSRNVMDIDDEQSKEASLGNAEPQIMEHSVYSVTKTLLEDLYLSEDSVDNPVIGNRLSHLVSNQSRSPSKWANSTLQLFGHSKEKNQNSFKNFKISSDVFSPTFVNENELRSEISVENALSAPTVATPPFPPTVVSPISEQIKALKLAPARSSRKKYIGNQMSIIKKVVPSCNVQPYDEDSNHKFEGLTSSICASTPLRRCLDFFHTERPSFYTSNLTCIQKSPNSKNPAMNLEEMPSISNLKHQELNKQSVRSFESKNSLINTSLSSLNESSEDSNTSKKLLNTLANSDLKSKAAVNDVEIRNEEQTVHDDMLNKPQSELCMLSAKKFNDGSVKFGFNLAKSCTITLNPNNYNISCIFNKAEEDSQCSDLPSLNNSQHSPALLSSSYSIVERQGFDANQSPVSDRQKLLENKLLSPVSMDENVAIDSNTNDTFKTIQGFKKPELASKLNTIGQTPFVSTNAIELSTTQLKDKDSSEDVMLLPRNIYKASIISPENGIISNDNFNEASNVENHIKMSSENPKFEPITKNTFETETEMFDSNGEDLEVDDLPSILVENAREVTNDTRLSILMMQNKNVETPISKCSKRIKDYSKNISNRRLRSGFNRFHSQKPFSNRISITNRISTLSSIRNRILPAKKRLRSFRTSHAVSEIGHKKNFKKKSLSHKKQNTYELESEDSDKNDSSDSGEWSIVKVDSNENSKNALYSFKNILTKHVKEVELMKEKLNLSNENELQSNIAEKNINVDPVSSITQVSVKDSDLKLKELNNDTKGFEDPTIIDNPYALFGSSLLDEDVSLHSLDSEPVKFYESNKNVVQNKITSIGKDFESEHDIAINEDNCSKSSDVSLQLLDTNTHLVEELTYHVSPTPESFENVISKHVEESSDKLKVNQSLMNEAMPTCSEIPFNNRNAALDESDTDSTDFESCEHKTNTPVISNNISGSFENISVKHMKKADQNKLNDATSYADAPVNNYDTISNKSNSDSTSSVSMSKVADTSLVASRVPSSFEEILAKHIKETNQNILHDETPSAEVLFNNHGVSLSGGNTDSTHIASVPKDTGTQVVSSMVPSSFEENLTNHVKGTGQDTLNDETSSAGILLNNHDAIQHEGDADTINFGSVPKVTTIPVVSNKIARSFEENLTKHVKEIGQDTLNDETSSEGVLLNNHDAIQHEGDTDTTNIGSALKDIDTSVISTKVPSSFEEILAKYMKETVQGTLNDVTSSAGVLFNNHDVSLPRGDTDSTLIDSVPKDSDTPMVSSIAYSSFEENLTKNVKGMDQDTLNDETPSAGMLLNNHDAILHEGNTDTSNIGSLSKDAAIPVDFSKVPNSFEEILTKHMEEAKLMEKRPSSPNFTELKKNLLNASFEDVLVAHIEDVKLIKENKKQQSIGSEKNNTTSITNETSIDNEVSDADSTASEHTLIIGEDYSSSSNSSTIVDSNILNKRLSDIMTRIADNNKDSISYNLKNSVKDNEDEQIDKSLFSNPKPSVLGNQILISNGENTSKNPKAIRVARVPRHAPIWVKRGKEFRTKDSATGSFNEAKTKGARNYGNSSCEINKSAKDDLSDMEKGKAMSFIKKSRFKMQVKKRLPSIIPDYFSKAGDKDISLAKSRLNVMNNNSGHLNEFVPSIAVSDHSTLTDSDIENCTKSELYPEIKQCFVLLEKLELLYESSSSDISDNDSLLKSEISKSYQKRRNKSHQTNKKSILEDTGEGIVSAIGKSCNEEFQISSNGNSSLCEREHNSDTEQTSIHVKNPSSSFNEGKYLLKKGVSISPRKRKNSSIEVENYADAKQKLDISNVECSKLQKGNKNKRKREKTEEVNLKASKKNKVQDCYVLLDPVNESSQFRDNEQNYLHNIIPEDNKRSSKNFDNGKNNVLRNKTGSDTHSHNKTFQTENIPKTDALKNGRLSQESPSVDTNENSNHMESKKMKGNVFYINQISTYSRSSPKIIEKLENSSNKEVCSRLKVKTIKDYFQFIQMQHEDTAFETNAQSLKIILSDPENYPDVSSLLFSVIKYLCHSEENPVLDFLVSEKVTVLLPREEDCLVTALFLIESEEISHLKGLLKTTVNKIQHIISKKTIHNYGLASLCRVVTEISKRKGDTFVPLFLCSTLLKMKHQFAPYLIASVAGIWRELFQVEEGLSDEEIIFHSAIAYGAKKKTSMSEAYWKASMKIISKYFDSRSVIDVQRSIRLLMNIIQISCCDDSWTYIHHLTSALVIFAVHEEWEWTKEYVLNSYVVHNLNRFGIENINEKAFDLFCNIYVDIFLVNPSRNPKEEVLAQFFKNEKISKDCSLIQESAALALMKLSYLEKIHLPKVITNWFESNCNDPKVIAIKQLFKRK